MTDKFNLGQSGRSGAFLSRLANLAARILDPPEGRIKTPTLLAAYLAAAAQALETAQVLFQW